ncbi:MAG: acyl-ACP desaturase [Chloroflexi bacterium]|uniref:Acyl-ACP desaturase n=1 Tax=Candidatus Chlorohelix allophototropha TaxID=3003348 RepID=A0A8T7LSS1_9CHLR|nr:acyl-ACP desaturase [Chloroflexota bacterium]WJW66958.1 acyl-ACP desaturase [Chloroflexota bacterium L227-S17]
MVFSGLYDKLERARWNMNDIPLDQIDKSKVDAEMLHDVKHVCLTELGSIPATRMFMRDFADDMDFQRFINVWSFEEGKHSLILERWLNANGVELEPEQVQKINLEFEPAPWIETLTMHFLGEQRLGMWYSSFAGIGKNAAEKFLQEPVLRKIFTQLSADEWRHAGCYFVYLKNTVAKTPEYLQNIARMMLWMLRSKYRHPTNITDPSVVDQLEDPNYFRHMVDRYTTSVGEKAMEKRVLSSFSILTGIQIETQKDVIKFLRNKFGQKSLEEVPS